MPPSAELVPEDGWAGTSGELDPGDGWAETSAPTRIIRQTTIAMMFKKAFPKVDRPPFVIEGEGTGRNIEIVCE